MHTFDDILQLLELSEENLNTFLGAIGWEGLTSFTDEQASMLETVHLGHTNHGWSYLESYLRKIADQEGVTPEEYDGLAEAISQAGGTLTDYKEDFQGICQRFKSGLTPEVAVLPPSDEAGEALQLPKDMQDLGPQLSEEELIKLIGADMLQMVDEQAETAAVSTVRRIERFATMAKEQQDMIEKIFILKYRQKVANKVLNPEFNAIFTQQMQSELDGEKKLPSLLDGVQTPVSLLSSSS